MNEKARARSRSNNEDSQPSQMDPVTLALETPPRGHSQLAVPVPRRSIVLPNSPPDPIDLLKSESDSDAGDILAMETPVKARKR